MIVASSSRSTISTSPPRARFAGAMLERLIDVPWSGFRRGENEGDEHQQVGHDETKRGGPKWATSDENDPEYGRACGLIRHRRC